MKFEKTTRLSHPASEVLEIMIEQMEKILPHLPNIEAIETQSRSEPKDGRIRIVRRWQGKSQTVPAVMRPFLSRDLMAWIDTAVWIPAEYKVEWRQRTCASSVAGLYECHGVNYFEPAVEDPDRTTQIRITGDLHVHPEKLPGMPRLLASRMAPQIEKFVIDLITPNLTDVAQALQDYLDQQRAGTKRGGGAGKTRKR